MLGSHIFHLFHLLSLAAIWITSFLKSLDRGIPVWSFGCICYQQIKKLSNFGAKVFLTAVELQMLVTKHVMFAPIRTCFPVTSPRLDENNGISGFIKIYFILRSVWSLPVRKSFSRCVFFLFMRNIKARTRVPATDGLRLDGHKITAKHYFAWDFQLICKHRLSVSFFKLKPSLKILH